MIGIDDVFDARMQLALTVAASSAYSACLSSGSSGAASITSSHGASPAIRSTASMRSQAARSSSADSLPRALAPSSPSSTRAAPRSAAPGSGSKSRVRMPAVAASCAIPDAHRAGARDADDGGQPARPAHAPTGSASRSITIGLSASMPVAARPMMSCWIWLVPS